VSWPLILACLWVVAAHLIAMLPSRDHHWRAAYILIGFGVPLVGWVTWVEGPWVGLIVLGAGPACSAGRSGTCGAGWRGEGRRRRNDGDTGMRGDPQSGGGDRGGTIAAAVAAGLCRARGRRD
jgi:hypothetical protein